MSRRVSSGYLCGKKKRENPMRGQRPENLNFMGFSFIVLLSAAREHALFLLLHSGNMPVLNIQSVLYFNGSFHEALKQRMRPVGP